MQQDWVQMQPMQRNFQTHVDNECLLVSLRNTKKAKYIVDGA